MLKLIIATHNKGKVKRYRNLFSGLDVGLSSLDDLGIKEKIEEPFKTPEENSAHKALEYAKIAKREVIAIDESLTTNFLPKNSQPGVFVRRLNKKEELSDRDVLDAWKKIFLNYKIEDLEFIWKFSLSYYNPKTKELQTVSATQIDVVAPIFSKIIDPGYPMSSFLIPKGHKKTYSEMSPVDIAIVDGKNLKPFVDLVNEISQD